MKLSTAILLVLAVGFAAVMLIAGTAQSAHIEREYHCPSRHEFATMDRYRAWRTFRRITGFKCIPKPCQLTVVPDGDPEDAWDLELCGVRIEQAKL